MVPKCIHFCWLGKGAYPPGVLQCIKSWKKVLPDYEIKQWDESRFNITSIPFVKQAVDMGMWAFAADFIRLHALYEEGGIYLDCDVYVRKSFDPFLDTAFFSSVEYHPDLKDDINVTKNLGILSAVMGSKPNHPFVRDCMEYYRNNDFISQEHQLNSGKIAPAVYAEVATRYGFQYRNEKQLLKDGITIYPSTVFASTPKLSTRDSYAVHYCAGSWRSKDDKSRYKFPKIPSFIRKNRLIRKIMGKPIHIDF